MHHIKPYRRKISCAISDKKDSISILAKQNKILQKQTFLYCRSGFSTVVDGKLSFDFSALLTIPSELRSASI